MEPWSCPACGREFFARRAHVCAPAPSVDSYFAGRPPEERAIFETVHGHVASLGPVIVEPVNVGIFFKGRSNFVEIRPKKRWVDVTFGLNRLLATRASAAPCARARRARTMRCASRARRRLMTNSANG